MCVGATLPRKGRNLLRGPDSGRIINNWLVVGSRQGGDVSVTVEGPNAGAVVATSYPYTEWRTVSQTWVLLAEQSSQTTYFLTPDWVDTWLEVYGARLSPELVVFSAGEMPVGACLLVRRTEWVAGFPVRRIYLNTAGEGEDSSACLEFNLLLALDGWERAVALSLARHIGEERWDEFCAPGVPEGSAQALLRETFAGLEERTDCTPARYVSLRDVRDAGGDYYSALAPKVRRQVASYVRRYESLGPLVVESAKNLPEALAALDRLAVLHQQTWTARGHLGSFGSPEFVAFHRALLRRAIPSGTAQLLVVKAGGEEVGLAYNFIHRGKVCAYSNGLSYREDNSFKPGFVTQVASVIHCLQLGLDEYDFMGGAQNYKREMGPRVRELAWMVFERRTVRMRAMRVLRRVKAGLESWKERRSAVSTSSRKPL
jgi:hypothetical protein